MALRVKEFVIQAQFPETGQKKPEKKNTSADLDTLKSEIVAECMEKIEEYIRKREGR